MKTITSRQNPIVKHARDVAARRDRSHLMLLDGIHLIEEALAARVRIVTLAATGGALHAEGFRALAEHAEQAGADLYEVSDTVMEAISPVRAPSGAVALAERPARAFETVFDGFPQLVVVGVDVQDPGNVGAIVRAAEAGGATGLVWCGASADPFGWKALRGSMGSALRLPMATATLDDVLTLARQRELRVAATVPRRGRSIFDVDLKRPTLVLLGGEGPGLTEEAVRAADERIAIPMKPPVESLNVAVAAALLVYEAARQRGGRIN